MSPELAAEELLALDQAVERALRTGVTTGLAILGYGEISMVLGWPPGRPTLACKRLPPFASEESFSAYRACVSTYLERLAAGGLRPVPTSVQAVVREDGTRVAYCLQPVLPREARLVELLEGADEEQAVSLFGRVVQAVCGAVNDRVGLDGQLSNWMLQGDGLLYLDVSTPLLRDDRGCELLDTELFMASLPWALRGLVRRFYMRQILDKYYVPRGVVVDLLANLYKEGLDRHLPALVERARLELDPPVSIEELRTYYRSDARMWALLQRLRHVDRFWQTRVRRRTYPFLLPGAIERRVHT